jgi:hypothetical protein
LVDNPVTQGYPAPNAGRLLPGVLLPGVEVTEDAAVTVRLPASPPVPRSHGVSSFAPPGAARTRHYVSADALAIAVFCALVFAAEWQLLKDGTVIGMDTATGFYPWYAYLGEQLRSGHIPMWNPYQFAGTPFAGDPESGWAYLPAVLLFTGMPLTAAADGFMAFHVLLAGLSTYALARTLGVPSIGALVSAIAYSFSGFFFGHNICCFAYSTVAAWLPAGLVGIERALRSRTWRARAGWWACGGLAVSQLLAAWVGQGAYYAILFLGAYLAYRTLISRRGFRETPRFVVHGTALLGVGFGLAAIGLLPRLEYNAVSNLPGGYAAAGLASPSAALSDWGIIEDWKTRLLVPGFHYVGLACLGLALLAPITVRYRHGVPFFFCMSLAVLDLARWQLTPVHVALSLLPGFGPMHMHAPERALIVWFICPALLAGATVGWLQKFGRWGVAVALGLAALVLFDLRWAWGVQLAEAQDAIGAYQLQQVDLAEYYAPTPAAVLLRSAATGDQARSIGYAQHVFGGPMPYPLRWTDPKIAALNVNNRALIDGLNDIQGYNPIHLARLEPFMRALNGQTQEYHQNDVLETGLDSPLLDLLGVRYLVMPVVPAADQVEPRLARDLPVIYTDADVKVLENARALPRAWIVHQAVQMDTDAALAQIADGKLDPRHVVLLEETPPTIDEAPDVSDEVAIVQYSPETVRIDVQTAAAGMLVLSDVIYPAWHARVDGAPAKIYAADGALRAVAIPPGTHTLEFEYTSAALPLGAAITALTVLVLAGAAVRLKRA